MKKKNVEEMLEHVEYQVFDTKRRKKDVVILAINLDQAEFLQELLENHLEHFDAWGEE